MTVPGWKLCKLHLSMLYPYCSQISLLWLKLYSVSNIYHCTVPQLLKYKIVEKIQWKGPLWVFYCSHLVHNSHQISVYDSMSSWVSQSLRMEIPHCLQAIPSSPSAPPWRTIFKIFDYNFLHCTFWPLSFLLMHLSDEKALRWFQQGNLQSGPLFFRHTYRVSSDTLNSRFLSSWSP